jgi:Rrf2 family transcriptional regulator, nitric oxide-sensitive transcriptional repressor
MIRQTAEYALRAVVYLASVPDACFTASQISETTEVPAGYLPKILQSLAREGIVKSQRGLKGGYRLNMLPNEIDLFRIISAVSVFERIKTCPLSRCTHQDNMCALHRKIDQTLEYLENSFRDTTIQDLLDQS